MTSNGQNAGMAGAVSPAPAETMMQAIVQDTYGSADICASRGSPRPEIADQRCSSGSKRRVWTGAPGI